MPTFSWSEFLTPLEPPVVAMSAILGLLMGALVAHVFHDDRRLALLHFWWQMMGGFVFFVPLSLIRAFQGSTVWERFLASLVLWIVFVGAMYLGGRIYGTVRGA